MITKNLIIRNKTDDDLPFIYHSWLTSNQQSTFSRNIPKQVYFDNHKKVIESILKVARVLVASDSEMAELIYGYAVYRDSKVFDYIYIKKSFTGFGIMTELTNYFTYPLNSYQASHMTIQGKKIIDKFDMVYNPYLLLGETC